MKTEKDFLGLSHAEVLSETDKDVTVSIPNRKEDLTVIIQKDVITAIDDDAYALQHIVKTLLNRHPKAITKETITINKLNYRIFI